jgi:hypothetical protein
MPATRLAFSCALLGVALLVYSRSKKLVANQRVTGKLVVATRVHQGHASKAVNLDAVAAFFKQAVLYADAVFIAVGDSEGGAALAAAVDTVAKAVEAEASLPAGTIRVLQVTPWGSFTQALNALLAAAAHDGASLLLYQSLETAVTQAAVECLRSELDAERDLVAGAALPGHDFTPGVHTLTGTTTPWNTLALWHVQKLARVGFLAVAEGLVTGTAAGVEEVTTIAVLQQLLGAQRCCAKLVRLREVQWDVRWEDAARQQWHDSKMASKLQRAHQQMAVLGAKPGRVLHIDRSQRSTT